MFAATHNTIFLRGLLFAGVKRFVSTAWGITITLVQGSLYFSAHCFCELLNATKTFGEQSKFHLSSAPGPAWPKTIIGLASNHVTILQIKVWIDPLVGITISADFIRAKWLKK